MPSSRHRPAAENDPRSADPGLDPDEAPGAGQGPREAADSPGSDRPIMTIGEMEVVFETDRDAGGALLALVDAARAGLGDRAVPAGEPFDLGRFAGEHGLEGWDLHALPEAAARGANAYCRERLGKAREGRPWPEVLQDSTGLGYFVREALRGGGPSPEARDRLAWYAVALLAAERLGRSAAAPAFVLLAVAHLAGRGELVGRALRAALDLALCDRDPLDGIATEELVPLWRAVCADPDAAEDAQAEALCLLVASAGGGRGPHLGTDLVSALARDDGLPLDVRRAALRNIADAEPRYGPFGRITPGVRRYALRHLAELEEQPWQAAAEMAREAEELEDPLMSRAAAEVLERHGATASEKIVRALVERGLGVPDAATRQAWYRTGVRLLGDEVREWAPSDVLARAERTRPVRDDSAQTTLF